MCISSRLTAQQQIQMNFKSSQIERNYERKGRNETQPLCLYNRIQAMKMEWWHSFNIIYACNFCVFFSSFCLVVLLWIRCSVSSMNHFFLFVYEMKFSILVAPHLTLLTSDSWLYSIHSRIHVVDDIRFHCARKNHLIRQKVMSWCLTTISQFSMLSLWFLQYSTIHQFTIIHFFSFIFTCLFF